MNSTTYAGSFLRDIWNSSWNTSGVKVDNANPARLVYNTVESSGAANLTCTDGSVILWFSPDWTSGGGPSGGRLLELGTCGATNDWWSLLITNNGTAISFCTGSNGQAMLNTTCGINWNAGEWHQVALTWSPAERTY